MSLVLVFVMFSATACAAANLPSNYAQPAYGYAFSVSAKGVMYGISQALLDKPGAKMFADVTQTKYVVAWFADYGASFFGVDIAENPTVLKVQEIVKQGGTLVNIKNGEQFVQFMKENGWKVIGGANAPKIFTDLVQASQSPSWFSGATNTLLIPLITFDPNLNPNYCGTGLATDLMYSVLCGDSPENKS